MINLLNVTRDNDFIRRSQTFPYVLRKPVKPQAIWLKRRCTSLACTALGSLRLIVSAVNGFLVIALEPRLLYETSTVPLMFYANAMQSAWAPAKRNGWFSTSSGDSYYQNDLHRLSANFIATLILNSNRSWLADPPRCNAIHLTRSRGRASFI